MADLKTVKPPAEKKRLAVFMDGTTDTSDGNTNVWRARSLCAPHGTDDLEQRVFYSVGVGTRMGEKARGEVFGYGIDDQVIEATSGWSRTTKRTTRSSSSVLAGEPTRRGACPDTSLDAA